MRNYFLITIFVICCSFTNGCKQNIKSNSSVNSIDPIDKKKTENITKEAKLNNSDKSIILKSEVDGKEFLVRKEINGQFMVDQDYSEKLKVTYGSCNIDLPRITGQAKIEILPKTLQHGDWDNDNKIDWLFAYRINEDGLDYVINYVIIANCQKYLIENIFFEDEDTFLEEYEEDVSHIENIKNARDFYKRNFVFQLEKQSKMNKELKSHFKNSFSKFIDSKSYK